MPTALNQLLARLRSDALRHDSADVTDGELLECYVTFRDDVAFEVLVRRHGPMVFGVCRRILQNDSDAEDAFQATFLVLVRKAATIRPRGMVGNWLYGVAHNTALKAKAMIHQRRAKETEAGTTPNTETTRDTLEHMQSVLDEELSLLPDKYRVPIILCDLEGKTIKEAMHHLGWPQGTVASRLTRGRALLAKRLAKHGLILSAGLLAVLLSQSAASASMPASLTATTVQAAGMFAAGDTAAASTTAVALADGVLKSMLVVKLKLATAVVFGVLCLAGLGGYLLTHVGGTHSRTHTLHTSLTPASARKPSKAPTFPMPPTTEESVASASHESRAAPPHEPAKPEIANPQRPTAPPPIQTKVIVIRSSDGSITATIDKAKQAVKDQVVNWRAYAVRLNPDGRVPDKLWVVLPQGRVICIQPFDKQASPVKPSAGVWNSGVHGPEIDLSRVKMFGTTSRVEVTIRVQVIRAELLKTLRNPIGDAPMQNVRETES